MKYVEIFEIEFEKSDDRFKTENYPHNGLFKVTDKESDFGDLAFVNDQHEHVFMIAPIDIFNRVCDVKTDEYNKIKFASEEISITESKQKYDPDFILEFARILLNRK